MYYVESYLENYIDPLSLLNEYEIPLYYQIQNIINESENTISSKLKNINPKKLTNSHNHNIKTIKTVLKNKGFNIDKLNKRSTTIAGILKSGFKSKTPPKEIAVNVIKNVKSEYQEQLKELDQKGISLGKAILYSLGILIIILIINTILFQFFSVMFGAQLAIMMTVILVAPFTEEYGRKIATDYGYPFVFSGVHTILESFNSIKTLLSAGYKLSVAILAQIFRLIFHLAMSLTHKIMREKEIKKLEEVGKNKEDATGMAGYYTAACLHLLWNLKSVVIQIIAFGGMKVL